MASCIYCPSDADGTEHWLPRSLGTFGPLQVLHETIRRQCNEAVGECDREFIRTGPEGIHRQGLGIEGKDGEGGNPFYYRAATNQPVQAQTITDSEDPDVFWETRPTEQGALSPSTSIGVQTYFERWRHEAFKVGHCARFTVSLRTCRRPSLLSPVSRILGAALWVVWCWSIDSDDPLHERSWAAVSPRPFKDRSTDRSISYPSGGDSPPHFRPVC